MKLLLRLIVLISTSFIFAQETAVKNTLKIDSLLNETEKIKDDAKKVDFLGVQISTSRYRKDTYPLADKAKKIALISKDDKLLAIAYFYLGNYHYFNSTLDSSLYYIKKTQEHIIDTEQPLLRAYSLNTEGGIYKRQGNMPVSISKTLASQALLDKIDTTNLDLQEKKRYINMTLSATNSLANYYNSIEEYKKAITYYEKGYTSSMSKKMYVPAGVFISNKGDLLLDTKKYEEALEAFLEGKRLKQLGNAPSRTIAISNLNIGFAYQYLKDFDKAKEFLDNSIDEFTKLDNSGRLAEAYFRRGTMYSNMGETNLAIEDCENSKRLSLENVEKEFISKSCNCLYNNYKTIGNTKKALENHELHVKTKDEIFNEKNVKKQTEQELQYEFNKTQELKNAELMAKENESKLYSILAVIGFLFASFLAFFFHKNRKKNLLLAKQKKLLEATVDEKNILLRETHHRVKNSFQMVSSLLFIQSETAQDKETKLAIKEAQNRVRSMVLIHQKLYSKDQLVGIDAKEYVEDFTKDVIESHQFENTKLNYKVQAEALVLSIETITPIGLILNELITNVLKHAFKPVTDSSFLAINFYQAEENLILEVIDNGVGMPDTIKDSSFGIELIDALSKKLKAKLSHETNPANGTIAKVIMKRFEIL